MVKKLNKRNDFKEIFGEEIKEQYDPNKHKILDEFVEIISIYNNHYKKLIINSESEYPLDNDEFEINLKKIKSIFEKVNNIDVIDDFIDNFINTKLNVNDIIEISIFLKFIYFSDLKAAKIKDSIFFGDPLDDIWKLRDSDFIIYYVGLKIFSLTKPDILFKFWQCQSAIGIFKLYSHDVFNLIYLGRFIDRIRHDFLPDIETLSHNLQRFKHDDFIFLLRLTDGKELLMKILKHNISALKNRNNNDYTNLIKLVDLVIFNNL